MTETLVVFVVLALLVIFVIAKTAVVVPQQSAYIVERLGKYRGTLQAGFHILTPFVDAVRYRHSLKESAADIPEQVCITRDNVQVHVDGVLYLKVLNPERASYGVMDYMFVNLILWGQQRGYAWFNLGMAPLSGLENRSLGTLWNRVGALA